MKYLKRVNQQLLIPLLLLAGTIFFNSGQVVAVSSQKSLKSAITEAESGITDPPLLVQETLDTDPNQDRFLQPAPVPEALPAEESVPVPTPETPPPLTDTDNQGTLIESIEVTGSSVFTEADFAPIIEPLLGTQVIVPQLQEVANAITQLYLDQDYITSRAILVEDSLGTSTPVIRIIEGSIEEIRVEGVDRLPESYARSRIRLGTDTPLSATRLEEQLRLLKANPLFKNVEANLRAGTGIGQSILTLRVEEADPWSANVNLDNYSPPSVGAVRVGARVSTLNLTGIGDQGNLSYYRTTAGGAESLGITYAAPINPLNGTLQARVNLSQTEVVAGEFADLDIDGESTFYEFSYRQPLFRTPREELAISVGFAHQNGQTFLDGSPAPFVQGSADGEIITSVFKVGQEYVYRQSSGAWAIRSLFSIGADVLGATVNEDTPDSRFFSWLGQVQRLQILNPDNFLIIQGSIQLSPHSLLPSQQFVIGGGQSLRGYRQNVRAGDNGFRASIEDRIILERNDAGDPTVQVAPFFDAGLVWNDEDNPSSLPEQRFLAGLGVGLLLQPAEDLNIRLDYGYPLIDLDDREDNFQDEGIYFSVDYLF